MAIDDADREYLDRNFERFGSAWVGGLAALELDFEIAVTKRWRRYELAFTTRGPERVTFRLEVHRKHGGMQGPPPALPEGPALDAAELDAVDAALRRAGELWSIGPRNDELAVIDLRDGIDGLRGSRTMETRRVDGFAVMYFRDREPIDDPFAVAVDLATGELASARWVELPANRSRLLEPATVDFLDRAMRAHGDFGVYGGVTEGLRALARVPNFELSLREDAESFHFDLTPRDGFGHYLHFPIDKRTGEIGECAAGHMEHPHRPTIETD